MKRLTTVAAVNDRINQLSDEVRALRSGLPLDSQGLFIPSRNRAIADIEGNQAEIDRLYLLKRRMLNEQYWQLNARQETTAPLREVAELLLLWKRRPGHTGHASARLADPLKLLKARSAAPAPMLAEE